jgi:hypothetical protein
MINIYNKLIFVSFIRVCAFFNIEISNLFNIFKVLDNYLIILTKLSLNFNSM